MAACIGQGPLMRPFEQHVKQPITIRFIQHHVSGHGNVATITDKYIRECETLGCILKILWHKL